MKNTRKVPDTLYSKESTKTQICIFLQISISSERNRKLCLGQEQKSCDEIKKKQLGRS